MSRSPSVSTRASTGISRPWSGRPERNRPFVPDPHRDHETYQPFLSLEKRKLGSFARNSLKEFRKGTKGLRSPVRSPREDGAPRITAADMDKEHHVMQQNMSTLKEAFKKLAQENARLHAERKENLFLIERMQGDNAGVLRDELTDAKAKMKKLERAYDSLANKSRREHALLKTRTATMEVALAESKRAKKDCETMMGVTVAVQKENVNLVMNPLVKVLQKKLKDLALRYKVIVDKMKVANEEQEERVVVLTERLTGLDTSVDELWRTTTELVQQRQDAAKLIKSGKEKIQEFRELHDQLTDQLHKMRSKVDEAVKQCNATMDKLKSDGERVEAMKKEYRSILENLVGQNKMWQMRYKEDVGRLESEKETLASETEQFRSENKALVESLMSYLLLHQTKSKLGECERAKEILEPLCNEAERYRKKNPPPEYDEKPLAPEPKNGERPLHERRYPSTQEEPSEEVIEALKAMPERPPDGFKGLAAGLPLMTALYTDGF